MRRSNGDELAYSIVTSLQFGHTTNIIVELRVLICVLFNRNTYVCTLGEVGLTFPSMKLICLLEAIFLPKNPKSTERVNGYKP
jgi:hypothetical protein